MPAAKRNIIVKAPKLRGKKCIICGKPVFSNASKYCLECHLFERRLHSNSTRRFSREAVKAIWDYVRKYGDVCYYTGMKLDMKDPQSPWYCVFDHWLPGNPKKVVLTSALVNGMKSDLTEKEFWYYVIALDNYRNKHLAIRKKKVIYWDRIYPQAGWMAQAPRMPGRKCVICGRPIKVRYKSYPEYCPRCARFARRMDDKMLPAATVKAIWDYVRKYGYVCYYTGMKLDMDDPQSPWYCAFDHWIPQDGRKVVLTSALINEMKLDLSEAEFWRFIGELADYKKKGTKVRKIKLLYWKRR